MAWRQAWPQGAQLSVVARHRASYRLDGLRELLALVLLRAGVSDFETAQASFQRSVIKLRGH